MPTKTTERLIAGSDRVTGPDESYLLAERLFGLSAPIQFLWVFDSDPGVDAVLHLRDELAAGPLNRKVVRAKVPGARDRWVRVEEPPEVTISPVPIADDCIAEWMDARVRGGALAPADGRGWKLESARTSSGRLVVSLLVSHMISDGEGVYAALSAADAGTSVNRLPAESDTAGWRGWTTDLVDAAGQMIAAGKALRVLGGALWNQFRKPGTQRQKDKRRPEDKRRPKDSASPPRRNGPGADTTLLIVDLERDEWLATARQRGGTTNSLFTALFGGLLQRADYPVAGDMRVCMAVSKREDNDHRANASGGVWIRLSGPITPERGLTEIRALSKQAFIDYADAGSEKVADNMQPVVRLLPDRLIGTMMQSIPGPDTTVSNLGAVPASTLRLGAATAESFGIRAVVDGRPTEHRRAQGPAVAAWAVEYGEKVTITVFGIHPDHFGDVELLRAQIGEELSAWGLSYRFW
jgi:hypothetical protein